MRTPTRRFACLLGTAVLVATAVLLSIPSAHTRAASAVPPPPVVSIGQVGGTFYYNPSNSGAFDASQLSSPAFSETFSVVDFNPPSSAQVACTNSTGIDENSRPFTDVIPNTDGSCSTQVATGVDSSLNVLSAGSGSLSTFEAVFQSTLTVDQAAQVTFNFFSDDGWILGLGSQHGGAAQPTYISGELVNQPANTPVSGYPVVGALNGPSAPAQTQVTVNFPAAGTYPMELDYTECCGGQLALTMGTTAGNPIPPSTLVPEFDCPATAPAPNPMLTSANPNPIGIYTPSFPTKSILGRPWSTLRTSGNQIVDTQGNVVNLRSVNWYGAESADYVPMGLDRQSVGAVASWIAGHGFDAVRLPWSNELVECNPTVAASLVSPANNSWAKLPAMTVFDNVVNALANAGLMVILDNHSTDAEWCCPGGDGSSDHNDLWWSSIGNNGSDSAFTLGEAHYEADWATMVKRYDTNPAVIGVDLRNEPRGSAYWGATTGGVPNGTPADVSQLSPNSQTACPDTSNNLMCDWRAAAQAEGSHVVGIDPGMLVLVEGVGFATDLTGAYSSPVTLSDHPAQLVYSAHVYQFSSYCNANSLSQCTPGSKWAGGGRNGAPPPCTFPCTPTSDFYFLTNWRGLGTALDSQWGFLAESGDITQTTYPVYVGEFGTNSWNGPDQPVRIVPDNAPCGVAPRTPNQNGWFLALFGYLCSRSALSWAYWPLNGTQSDSSNYIPQQATRTFGAQEIYGLLDTGWGSAAAGQTNSCNTYILKLLIKQMRC